MVPRPETPDGVAGFRAGFPIFNRLVHLANNSRGAMHERHREAHERYLREWETDGADWDAWVGAEEELRERFAALFGATPAEVAVTPSATSGLASLVSALDPTERPVLVIDDHTFPSPSYLWIAQQARGFELRRVAPDAAGDLTPEAFDAVLDERVAAVLVSHVCFKNGHRLAVGELGPRVREVGALMIVDDYQSTGTCEMDLAAMPIDVLTTGTLKFLLGSPGVGMMYVREGVSERLDPTAVGWFGQADPHDMQIFEHRPSADARRFQIGCSATPAVYDSVVGLELVAAAGLGEIESWIRTLTGYLIDRLGDAGFVSATPADPVRRGALVGVRAHDAEAVVANLGERGILVSHREGNVRVAPHYYNVPADVDVLIEALDQQHSLLVEAGDPSRLGTAS